MLHYFFTIYEKKRQMAMLIPLLFIGSHVLHQFFTIWARGRDGNSDKYTAHRKSASCYIFTPSKPGRRGHFWQLLLYIGSTFRKSFDSISQEASLTFLRWSNRGNFFLFPCCKGALILWTFDNLSVHCIMISKIIILALKVFLIIIGGQKGD